MSHYTVGSIIRKAAQIFHLRLDDKLASCTTSNLISIISVCICQTKFYCRPPDGLSIVRTGHDVSSVLLCPRLRLSKCLLKMKPSRFTLGIVTTRLVTSCYRSDNHQHILNSAILHNQSIVNF